MLAIQEERRQIGRELSDIRKESNALQDQIHRIKRHEDYQGFLDLMRAETEVLKREQDVTKVLSDCDKHEREVFTAFTNAVRDSHEKQRAQVEYTKYFGLILSIFGSFLTFVYSTYKKRDLKNYLEEKLVVSQNHDGSAVLIKELKELKAQVAKRDTSNASIIKGLQDNYKDIKRYLGSSSNNLKSPSTASSNDTAAKVVIYGVVGIVALVILKSLS